MGANAKRMWVQAMIKCRVRAILMCSVFSNNPPLNYVGNDVTQVYSKKPVEAVIQCVSAIHHLLLEINCWKWFQWFCAP